uniref:hypothetical protein n=1 Tax=Orrella sp. TaxID=1921583 RepID=UPI004048C06B
MASYLTSYLACGWTVSLHVFVMFSSVERQIVPAICLLTHQPSSVSFRLLRAIEEKQAGVSAKTQLPLTFV